MKKKGLTLRGKLTFIIIAAIIVSVGIVTGISIYSMQSEMEQQIMEHQMLLAKAFTADVEQFFEDAKGMIRTASYLPAVRDVSSIPWIRQDIKGVPQDMDIPKRDVLNNIIEHFGDFRYMEQVTADVGNNIVLEPYEWQLDLTQLDFGHRDWFKGALAKMDAHVSEVYISSSLQRPVVAVSHPVTDDAGRPRAVLMGALTLDRLNRLCQDLNFGETGYVCLVDKLGTCAAHRDSTLTDNLTSLVEIPMVQKAMAGETGAGLFFDPRIQDEVLSAYMPIGDTGWSLIVVQDPDEAFAPVRATATKILIAVGVLLLIAVIIAIWVANSIANPIKKLAIVVEKLGEGDLTVETDIRSRDEIGILADGFNNMVERNNEVLSNINSAAEQVAAGAKQVSVSSQALSQGAAEQASSIEEVTSSITQIAAQTKQNADNANQANELTLNAKTIAVQGNEQMREMVRAMGDINDSSNNISKIIKVIDDLAFQTNILSLNAAVEAARAGQHGKGFAVVAEEVRNLAARSANAAKETTALIEDSMQKAEDGTKIANETAEALHKIVDGVTKAAELVGNIASASNEQATGLSQINQAIDQVSTIVQRNSATAEESASASEELSSQAELLKGSVGRFKLRKASGHFSNGTELTPEMIRMLEDMLEKRNQFKPEGFLNRSKEELEKNEGTYQENSANEIIVLDGDNFEKY